MPSFSNLRSEAQERWQPEEGGVYTVIVVECRNGETKNGYPSINLWLEIVDGMVIVLGCVAHIYPWRTHQ